VTHFYEVKMLTLFTDSVNNETEPFVVP